MSRKFDLTVRAGWVSLGMSVAWGLASVTPMAAEELVVGPLIRAGDSCQATPQNMPNDRSKSVYIECGPDHKGRKWSCLAYVAKYDNNYDDCVQHRDPDRLFRCIFLPAAKGQRSNPVGTCGATLYVCNPPGLGMAPADDLPVAALIACNDAGEPCAGGSERR